jgi:hypothetical protein
VRSRTRAALAVSLLLTGAGAVLAAGSVMGRPRLEPVPLPGRPPVTVVRYVEVTVPVPPTCQQGPC